LAAIELDDQTRVEANEISDVAAEGDPSAEFVPVDLACSRDPPKRPLDVGRIPTQRSRPIERITKRRLLHFQTVRDPYTPTQPTPARGRAYLQTQGRSA
jgi:hypothetical protein